MKEVLDCGSPWWVCVNSEMKEVLKERVGIEESVGTKLIISLGF